ncbi:MAG: ATP-dependent helicase [Armatimonas sp.]
MSSAAFARARIAARAVRLEHPNVEVALRAEGLKVRSRPPGDALLSGAHAVLDVEAERIWIRADAKGAERALILAHELGHVKLHHSEADSRCDEGDLEEDPASGLSTGYGPRQRREAEANVFAREFLLPADEAQALFASGLDAPAIASKLSLPESLVYSQLAASPLPLPPAPSPEEGGGEEPREGFSADPALSGTPLPFRGGAGGEVIPGILDPSQQIAAEIEKGPLLVGAGPGTGKTRTLTARVLHLLTERNIAPENILCLTFSRKAADELRERLAVSLPDEAGRLAISTFHAWGLDFLRRRWRAAGLPPRPILLTEVEALALMERRVAEVNLDALRYLHDPAYPLPDALRAISKLKEARDTPDGLEARAAGDPKWTDVAILWRAYDAVLKDKGALDFADLIARPLAMLEGDAALLAAERAQWKHVLVDEYQDVNRSGARLVQLLTGEGEGLWAVGDLRQAIYAFRGASPANVTQFAQDFPTGQRKELAVNYRSRPALVELFGIASGEGPAAWESKRAGLSSATLAVAPDDMAQADGIAAAVRRFTEEGFGWGDQVVLCRTRNQARVMREMLTERGVPVAPGGNEGGLLADPTVRRLVALIARVIDPTGPGTRLWPEVPAGLSGDDAYAILTTALWGPPRLAATLNARAAERLLALALSFRERAELLLEPGENHLTGFLDHLRRLARLGASLGEPDEVPENTVRVLTVHASKGLEFPIVFVPNLSAGRFPPRPAPGLLSPLADTTQSEEPDVTDEEARLFFVALTRARDHLILSRAEKYRRISAQPSPLLVALNEATNLERVEWVPPPPPSIPPFGGTGEPEPPITGGQGGNKLPVGDVELYLRCPRRYFYEKVEKVPGGPPSAYDAFKRATLAALREERELKETWDELGPSDNHPHARLYLRAASAVVEENPRRAGWKRRELNVTLPSGAVLTVTPDAVTDEGTIERHTFRRPPEPGTEAPSERTLSLLNEAAEQNGLKGGVAVRYLQNDQVATAPPRPRSRKNHLEHYERAIRGIQLQMFPPIPDDASACPSCPYFFICPD